MSIDFEVMQTLLDLCSRPLTANEICSADYRHLLQGLLTCSREELQWMSQENQALQPRWVFTNQQLDELEALHDDLQKVRGFYARRLRVILDAAAVLPAQAS